MRVLSICENKLVDVKAVGHLSQLERLEVAGNLIDELHPLPGLQSLVLLNLANNSLRHIPILQTAGLKELNMAENLIQKIENLDEML